MKSFNQFIEAKSSVGGQTYNPVIDGPPLNPRNPSEFIAQLNQLRRQARELMRTHSGAVSKYFDQVDDELATLVEKISDAAFKVPEFQTRDPETDEPRPDNLWGANLFDKEVRRRQAEKSGPATYGHDFDMGPPDWARDATRPR